MARMAKAIWQGEHSPGRLMLRYDAVCYHTIVGSAPAHAAHFSVTANGTILQSRDTAFRSAANLDGNHRIIAIENEDHGPPFPDWDTSNGKAVPALTKAQVKSNGEILAWAHLRHGIPLKLAPNSLPTSRGLAYHRQGIDGAFLAAGYKYGGRVPGGEHWSSARGKVCPGDLRIDQRVEILAHAELLVKGKPMARTLTDEDRADIQKMIEDALRSGGELIRIDSDGDPESPKWSLETMLRSIRQLTSKG